jgi:hypothetical protein
MRLLLPVMSVGGVLVRVCPFKIIFIVQAIVLLGSFVYFKDFFFGWTGFE